MGSEGWATVGHRGRPVIKPDAGEIEVWRLRAQLWRNRPDQAVVSATVGRTSAVARVALAEPIVPTPFSSPVTASLTDSSLRKSRRGSPAIHYGFVATAPWSATAFPTPA